ncbi:TPA: UvrD-helicase domain-containing protein [Burkholderia vietnamiensis]|nr:UvrD-helicase domain-containing protein [Burkholderia vietnamiensis]MBR8008904.1 UvrD-helicase domain-containing protein [Burkholderia vietnamiensis]HDR8982640.1 UvrD-helicase domain-containing protein [Burkholderia vietnamiensis]HDR9000965.1 UvrD-helicase domain-containing protein [Burkholderia vietnamiensis]HDR9073640.1 UvrD-helicase domain-containing protein [Burkholderia vietnamiensis]
MTNADSDKQWGPSHYGQIFTKSRDWVLRLVDGGLVLFVGGKVKIRHNVDGKSRPLIKHGLFWADVTFRAGKPDAIRIDGLPNKQATELEEAIAACERPYQFKVAFGQIQTWLQQGDTHLAQCEQNRRWIPQSWQAGFESRRPCLELSDEELWKLFRDPSVRASLPGEAGHVESVLKIWRRDWPAYWAQKNEAHTRRELVACREMFEEVEGKPLTEEQARAVICFDDHVLVVASAGSGKTSTMVAKAAYAIRRGIVRPDQILMLAFNKKAADELQKRAGKSFGRLGMADVVVEARTFHALGLSIIGKATGEKPDVPDWAIDAQPGQRKLTEIVDRLKDSSPTFRTNWDLFRIVFGQDLPKFGKQSNSDVVDGDANAKLKTIDGKFVRSQEECFIANWLFYHGVGYVYERPYEHETRTAEHRQYKPDFYYPDIDLYHEHFALDANGEPPSHFENYLEGVVWKREEHQRRGTQLIETTSHQVRTGEAWSYLEHALTSRGIVLDPNPDRPVPQYGQPPLDSALLIRLVRSFIVHTKSNCLSVEDMRKCLSSMPHDTFKHRHWMFLDLFEPILEAWNGALAEEGGIDFEDMLNQAAEHVESGRYFSPYGLVMADEFQDASRARARLCRALANARLDTRRLTIGAILGPVQQYFFAVGDDWQSINRFAGADVSVMTGFVDWFGKAQVLRLEQTFRCPQTLCDISSRFVTKNPRQIRKNIRSSAPATGAVLEAFQVKTRLHVQKAIDDYLAKLYRGLQDGSVPRARDGKITVFILGRYNADKSTLPFGWQVRYGGEIVLSFVTIHSSKGAEADYVILPGMVSRGFPNLREDDPVLALAMPGTEPFPLAEERRLFYVALTRARRSVAMFTVAGHRSSFLQELVSEGAVTVSSTGDEETTEYECPACNTGLLNKREGRYGQFLTCSNFPACRYKPPVK